jgi:hypothetical protein
MFLLFHDPTIQEHPVEDGLRVIPDAVLVKLKKNSTQMPTIPGVLLQAPLHTAPSDPLR